MSDLPLYLDHQATTPTDPRVVEAMLPYFSDAFGNAASRLHAYGWRAEAAVEMARETIARCVGAASERDIIFTSGATESNNLALLGAARAQRAHGDHVVTVATEHLAVLDPCRALAAEGFRTTELPVDASGRIDLASLEDAIDARTLIVSVMAANNEIGVLQPLEEIGALCRERGVLFHSDAAQAVGKVPLDVGSLPIDLLSFTAHKIYGPKGVGALWMRPGRPRVNLAPILHGGGHERGLRSGTLPVPLIVGFARALELAVEMRDAEAARLVALRDDLLERLCRQLSGVFVNGELERRLPGNLNVGFVGVDADMLVSQLPDLALSTGSACTSARPEPSHVLRALGRTEAEVRASIRVGLGRGTDASDIATAAARIAEEVEALRSAAPAVSGA